MWKFRLFLFNVFIAILRDFKQCKGGIDTFYLKEKPPKPDVAFLISL